MQGREIPCKLNDTLDVEGPHCIMRKYSASFMAYVTWVCRCSTFGLNSFINEVCLEGCLVSVASIARCLASIAVITILTC